MSYNDSMNELDRAVMRMAKSHAALPDLMRCLSEGELWTFIPWHPEVEDTDMELTNGMQMPFSQFEDEKGVFVPIFSSFERAREAMKQGRFPGRTYSAAAVDAKILMLILGGANLRAHVNRGCKTGGVLIGPDMMRGIADGTALATNEFEPTKNVKLKKLDPADYPTNIVQSLFELMRQHKNFRAAWIFGRPKSQPEPPNGRGYNLMVLMEPRDAVLCRDLNLVAGSAAGKLNELELGYVPINDGSYTAKLFAEAEPFYVAADYERPVKQQGGE